MPPTFADMKQEHTDLQENNTKQQHTIHELEADKKKFTEKIIAVSKLTLPQIQILLWSIRFVRNQFILQTSKSQCCTDSQYKYY